MVNRPSQSIELFIAQLLRVGVIASFVIVAIGTFLLVGTGATGYGAIRLDDVNSIVQFQPSAVPYPNTLAEVIQGVLALKPYAIIALGLLLLIAIPVMRVAVSVLAFAWERDWLYVAITLFVLGMLLASFAMGGTGG
jgi:uncharacterized membrane protein